MGDSPEDPIVGTVAHVPYPWGVEMSTVRGVHRNKGGVVWVQYGGKTNLYEVACGLLFSPEEAETYQQDGLGGKNKAKTTTNPSNPETNSQSNQPQPTTTEVPNPIDKENKENKEPEGVGPVKGSHEP